MASLSLPHYQQVAGRRQAPRKNHLAGKIWPSPIEQLLCHHQKYQIWPCHSRPPAAQPSWLVGFDKPNDNLLKFPQPKIRAPPTLFSSQPSSLPFKLIRLFFAFIGLMDQSSVYHVPDILTKTYQLCFIFSAKASACTKSSGVLTLKKVCRPGSKRSISSTAKCLTDI